MKHIYGILSAAVLVLTASLASASPDADGAVINERIFNDCPTSILTTVNNYPSQIVIDDQDLSCVGFANLHNWRLAVGGAEAVFNNDSAFFLEFDLVISGTAEGEGGLSVAPWWSHDVDGRFNVRTTDGEIACFGGRLPFYSFTGSHGLNYVKGDTITLRATYHANGLSMADPATIEYGVTYNGTSYTSGPLPFDEGNPAEDPPYGLWGMLNDGRVGGYLQVFLQAGNPLAGVTGEYSNIVYQNLKTVSVESESWGGVKALYR